MSGPAHRRVQTGRRDLSPYGSAGRASSIDANVNGEAMTTTILVGVAGGEPSRVAVRWSMRWAAEAGAEVRLVHVLDDEWATVGARMLDDLRADALHLVETEADYARSLAPEVAVRSQLLEGSLMWELIAASEGADLTAVGTHKTGFIHGKVFGSRSLQLAAAAHSHVAIIPQASGREGHGVVVGVDDSAAGVAAVRFAAAEAHRSGQNLTLLRAWDPPELPAERRDTKRAWNDELEARTTALLSAAAATAVTVDAALDVRLRSVRRPAAEALLDAAASATLLVVGSSRRGDRGQAVLGSVSHDVLLNLVGPTIVVHGDDE